MFASQIARSIKHVISMYFPRRRQVIYILSLFPFCFLFLLFSLFSLFFSFRKIKFLDNIRRAQSFRTPISQRWLTITVEIYRRNMSGFNRRCVISNVTFKMSSCRYGRYDFITLIRKMEIAYCLMWSYNSNEYLFSLSSDRIKFLLSINWNTTLEYLCHRLYLQ